MKNIISILLLLAIPKITMADTIVYNYSKSMEDFVKVTKDVAVNCKTASNQIIELNQGILSVHGKELIDLLDRELIAYITTPPLVINILEDSWTFSGIGGPAHIDYPNELKMTVMKSGAKGAVITVTINEPYEGRNKTYTWECMEYSVYAK